MKSCEDCGQSQEAVRVKDEPEHPPSPGDCYLARQIKEETDNAWHSECLDETEHVKQEASCVDLGQQEASCSAATGLGGVSAAAALAGLYTDHTVKAELVLGPEVLHRSNVTPVCFRDCYLATPIKEETDNAWHSECLDETGHVNQAARCVELVQQAPSCSAAAGARGMSPGLYTDHTVKGELVLEPEVLHRPNVTAVCCGAVEVQNAAVEPGRMWRCSVRLERLLLGAERRTCRVGRRTYRLRAASEPRRAAPATDIYRCDYCDKAFGHKSVLRKHIHTHLTPRLAHSRVSTREDSNLDRHLKLDTRAKPFKCVYCTFKCSFKQSLRRHEMTHNGEYPFQCDYCDFKCIQKGHLRTHVMKHTGIKPIQCNYCDYKCRRKSDIRNHEMTHTGVKPFQCKYCDYKCRQKRHLRNHEITHTGEYPFQCDYCDYKCIHKTSLKTHVMKHTGIKPFHCNYCDFKSIVERYLRNHEMTHTGEYPFQCDYCDYKCSVKQLLRNHEMTHTGEYPFQCDYCDYKCIHKTSLKTHVMKHTGIKPFQCNYCDYKCRLKKCLRIHEMTHTGVKPFQCNYCDYKCRQKIHLRNHEMTHTGVKPFQCNYCDYKCRRKILLQNHRMTHTGEKPFQCNYCDYKCREKRTLKTHEMKH